MEKILRTKFSTKLKFYFHLVKIIRFVALFRLRSNARKYIVKCLISALSIQNPQLTSTRGYRTKLSWISETTGWIASTIWPTNNRQRLSRPDRSNFRRGRNTFIERKGENSKRFELKAQHARLVRWNAERKVTN